MTITFAQIHTSTNRFDTGTILINTAFTGNVLAIECTTKPEYLNTEQIVGYLYQFNGTKQAAYAIKSGRDMVRLELDQTSRLMFLPTRYLLDSYTLTIAHATVGNIIDGSNSVIVPEELLILPLKINVLETWQLLVTNDIEDLLADVSNLKNQVVLLQACCNGVSPNPTPSPTPTPTPTQSSFSLRINCGGTEFTDVNGDGWMADQYFTGGQTYDYASLNIPAISAPPSLDYLQQLFANERSSNFAYQIPCPNGIYRLNLYFCEVGMTNAGSRIFDVMIGDVTVIQNFDIFSEVGYGLATKEIFTTEVTNGLMFIHFNAIVDNPQINGIEIIQV